MVRRDPNGLRFAVPVLLVLAFAVAWGEWMTRVGEAFAPFAAGSQAVAARVDAWIDPPPYTGQAPVFLSRRADEAAAGAITVPEGSKLTVRVVSTEPVEVTVTTAQTATALPPAGESQPAAEGEGETIRSYEAVLDRDASVEVAHADGTQTYTVAVSEDRPPTITRGPLTVNRTGSFTINFDVADDYGVTEGNVTFRPAQAQPEGARPLVDAPSLPLRIERAQARAGPARADGRLEAHPYAGLDVIADAMVKDAAGQEARPPDPGPMVLPARPFYNPLARALIEQRRLLALDANRRGIVAIALDALTVAPERINNAAIYLGLRVGYHRLRAARTDDQLREMLDYLWTMARAVEDGDMSDAEERLAAAREALEQALQDGAPQEEIARLMDDCVRRCRISSRATRRRWPNAGCRRRPCRRMARCRRCPSRTCRKCSTASRIWRSSDRRRPPRNCSASCSRCSTICRWRSPARCRRATSRPCSRWTSSPASCASSKG
jgi:uncharacterized protein (TIGR02302 family)